MRTLEIQEIKKFLPHRFPMLLVDRVLNWESGKNITAIKNVTINEEFFKGHFPNKPVMPGVLTIEALAQSSALLAFLTNNQKIDDNAVVYFLGIDKARFKKPVIPGDQLKMHVEILRQSRGVWKFHGIAKVDAQLVVEAELMCTMRNIDEN